MAEPQETDQALQRKVDPEALVLRGRPRPVIRFRKSVIASATAIISASLIGLTWISLAPRSFHFAGKPQLERPIGRPPTDALSGAPARYSDIPRLGPPLPGDLGRPIVEQQRELAAKDGEYPPPTAADREVERAAVAQERRMSEEREARSSGLIVRLASAAAKETDTAAPTITPPTGEAAPTGPAADSLSSQEHKVEFVRSTAGTNNAHTIAAPAGAFVLAAGTIIPASLITGINSDLPGMVIAQVTENVRDTATGRTTLIPQGARLIGQYDSSVSYGQKRALIVWNRILFPDASSLALDKMPAGDTQGHAGLEDRVDFHEWRLLKGIALSTLLGLGSQLSLGGRGEIARAIRETAQQNTSRAGNEIVSRDLDVQPTIAVRPGWPVRAIVNEDLILEPWKG